MKTRICLSANTSWYLFNFRRCLLRRLIEEGYDVIVISPLDEYTQYLLDDGCQHKDIRIDNKGINPWKELMVIVQFWRLYRALSPSVVIQFTIKPVIYGTIVATIRRILTVNTITGLGTTFLSLKKLRFIIVFVLGYALKRSNWVFFQNQEDQKLFVNHGMVYTERCSVVGGSGVDVEHFQFKPMSVEKTPVFILVARLLWDKGIGEFVEAARKVKEQKNVIFRIAGPLDVANRSAIPRETLDLWIREGIIEYLGEINDIRNLYENSTCVVLPSYREGLSKVLIEAAAMGRPIITTSVPGCKDVVIDGYSGLLCRAKDSDDLAAKMFIFLGLSRDTWGKFGKRGRALVRERFSIEDVNNRYLSVVETIIDPSTESL